MDDLKKIVKLVLLTGNLRNYNPVSLLIVSKSGNGKTELITSYKKKSAAFVTDLSYAGLLQYMKQDKNIKHIIIPDFIKITQKKRSTTDNLVSLLNAFLEEGVGKMKVFNQDYDFEGRKIGLITATTKDSFGQKKSSWGTIGFVQRMLVVSYDYTEETFNQIMESINKEEFIKSKKENITINGKDITTEEKFNKQLNKLVLKNLRSLKHLQALAKANAIDRGSDIVEQEDIDEVIRLSKYMNLEYNKV